MTFLKIYKAELNLVKTGARGRKILRQLYKPRFNEAVLRRGR